MKENRIGETTVTKEGYKATIIECKNSMEVLIKFENGYTTTKQYVQFRNGEIKNPYHPSVYNIGYIGEGKYKVSYKNKEGNYRATMQYEYWRGMILRCYSKVEHKRYPTYQNCIVCEEWHNFQSFAKWYDKNYYQINNEKMCLDKDILFKGNKVYAPNTCMFVPDVINSLIVNSKASRGDLPMGVTLIINSGKYLAKHSLDEKTKTGKSFKENRLGNFNTSKEAFNFYKVAKEKFIKSQAEKYKECIPQKLYDALYDWKIEITD